MSGWRRIALGLGSSLPPRRTLLEDTLRRLATSPDLEMERVSPWVRTPPLLGGAARNWFLNGVALLRSGLAAEALLDRCIALEAAAGRRRQLHWADRPLDLDILLVEGECIDTERLVVPHPAIAQRPFVLEPLLQVWSEAVDPCNGRRYADLEPAPGPRPAPAGCSSLPSIAGRPVLRYL
ncbi:MAG: 2-amino-4-hydroxy-6-hydroxymethyldihydropteridine diphosphokinase [Myxococcota bacterium]